jgi:cobalt-zinc-cadmium efflux system membrane fusion protein
MNISIAQKLRPCKRPRLAVAILLGVAILLAALAALPFAGSWLPPDLKNMLSSAHATADSEDGCLDESADEHAHEGEGESADEHSQHTGKGKTAAAATADEHDHADEPAYDHPHDEASAITLSRQAIANVGLKIERVELQPFERTVSMPGMVVERPGWSTLEITAPMTGVITRIFPIQGEAVKAGQPLFEIRLTHEDLLQLQTEFLRTVEELDVIAQEVARLEKAAADGAIAGKTLLDRKYEQQKQQAALRSQRQALLLHGLTPAQVDNIVSQRTLLQSVAVSVPALDNPAPPDAPKQRLQVQQLRVSVGKHVAAGDMLCILADHSQLYIEGKAFEQDAEAVNRAAAKDWKVSAVMQTKDADGDRASGLSILYVDDRVDPESRAFHYYLTLPNKLVRTHESDGRRFSTWQFRPGQRVELLVPVEQWSDRIVLPVNAVVRDGPESYVFEQNDGHFDRRAVHVEYRDEYSAVIANDGSLAPGKMVVVSGSYQVHLAMKNKAGGAPDPHAGHNH